MINKEWWKEAIVYQIYPRSFNDSNHDGIGDIPGIIEKLDYIESLGIDVIWLCPVYQSPNDDNGYDISDYYQIMTDFGTMEDFDQLLDGVHKRGIKLIMDLVPNHTSDEHEWFLESKKSKDNPYRDYYIWKGGEPEKAPTNWPSFFTGNAWQYDEATKEHYLHLFSKKQPDLNWENPKVRQEIYDVMHFWFKKGIDGFRMDVVSLISKPTNYTDATATDFTDVIAENYANGPRVHEFLKEMHHEVLSHYDCMTVGEGPGITLDNALNYVGNDRNELQMIFHFGHMYIDNGPGGKYDPVDYDLIDMKKIFTAWDEKLAQKGWGSIFLGNHDFPRIVSRFGNDMKYWEKSAKVLASLLLCMRGTTFIYQGDEIGMTNVIYENIDDYRDIETLNSWKDALTSGKESSAMLSLIHRQSRDNARTPMQWSSGKNAGFSEVAPWIGINPNFAAINVEQQMKDEKSILTYYRKMIAFRKANNALVYGDYNCILEEDPELYIFERSYKGEVFLVMLNFSEKMREIDAGFSENMTEEIGNYEEAIGLHQLRPWEAKVLKGARRQL